MSDHFRPRSSRPAPEPSHADASAAAELDALLASVLSDGVEALLVFANDVIVECAECAAVAVRSARPGDSRERRALAVAMGVLLGIEVSSLVEGLPGWLVALPEATVRSVRRRRNERSWVLLIEVGTPEHHVVSAHVVLSEHNEITSGFVIDEQIGDLEKLIRSIGGERGRSFSVVRPTTVAPDLLAGLARRQLSRFQRQGESRQPDNEPLIAWVVRLVTDASRPRRQAAA